MTNAAAIQAERAVLGSVIAGDILPGETGLSESDFFEPPHQRIWRVIEARSKRGCLIHAVLLHDELAGDPGFAGLGGVDGYLAGLLDEAIDGAAVNEYAQIVRAGARKRAQQVQLKAAEQALAENDTEAWQAAVDALGRNGVAVGGLPRHWSLSGPGRGAEALDSPPWLIKTLLGEGDLGLIFGPSGCGKSFLAMGIAYAVASGLTWWDLRCSQGAVLYVAAEGARGVRLRQLALETEFGTDAAPLYVLDAGPVLSQSNDVDGVLAAIREVEKESGCAVSLVVIDTLARTMPGANENSFEDMGAAIGALNRIQREGGVTVIAVHHTGKDSGRGPRGHSSLIAAVDTAIEIDPREPGADGTARVVKQKDGESGQVYGFRLKQVELATDADGDPVTSCIVEAVEAPDMARCAKTDRQLAVDVAMAALRKSLDEHGHLLVDIEGIPSGTRAVNVSHWRATASAAGISSGTSREAGYQAFRRAKDKLLADGLIGISGDSVWLNV